MPVLFPSCHATYESVNGVVQADFATAYLFHPCSNKTSSVQFLQTLINFARKCNQWTLIDSPESFTLVVEL